MPLADLQKPPYLVRFKWSYHRDIVTIHVHDANPGHMPLRVEKKKKTAAQKYWKLLVKRGFKHIGTYENGQQIK